ncbi:unnamed protein product [Vitrella brassicaformis CCMP3155]|uniref:Uncharacterized protein n=1 Tax=Vitrella brassicaformis (strain CCMP3155) TaxID=1169540 RepID=A0A0G4E8H5_VITBC|nr:unnamed protein product [Vitrella brassicaformis CCMP3155]|eukprot:CEL92059.1 unnamed protein product [Vitrella brassicaformis CCMP3155]
MIVLLSRRARAPLLSQWLSQSVLGRGRRSCRRRRAQRRSPRAVGPDPYSSESPAAPSAAPPTAHPSQQPSDVPHDRSDVHCAGGDDQPAEYRGRAFNRWRVPCHELWPGIYSNLTAYERPRLKELRRYLKAAGKAAWGLQRLRAQCRKEYNAAKETEESLGAEGVEEAYLAAVWASRETARLPSTPRLTSSSRRYRRATTAPAARQSTTCCSQHK